MLKQRLFDVLVDSSLAFSHFVGCHFGYRNTFLVAEKNLGVAQIALVFGSKNIFQASFMNIVVTLLELRASLPVNNFSFTKNAIDFGIRKISVRWLKRFLEPHEQPTVHRNHRLFLL